MAAHSFWSNHHQIAGNQDRHKCSVEFDFKPDQTTHFGVTCPWVTKISYILTWISLKPAGQAWSSFICSITGVGKGCIMFWCRLDQNSGVHGKRKPLWLIMGKMMSPSFLHLRKPRVLSSLRSLRKERSELSTLGLRRCLFSVSLDPIRFIPAGNEDMYKISDEFEFWPDRTTDYGVSCPWGIIPIDL